MTISLASQTVQSQITRRAILVGAVAVPLSTTALAKLPPVETFDPTDRRILKAYSAWLHWERVTLCAEIFPEFPEAWQSVPGSTGLDSYHLPYLADRAPGADDCGPNQAPSLRAARVLRTVGADLEQVVRRSIW